MTVISGNSPNTYVNSFGRTVNTSTSTANRATAPTTTAGAGDTFETTGPSPAELAAQRQEIVNSSLSSLQNRAFPPAEAGESLFGAFVEDVNDWMSPNEIAAERAPFEARLRALSTSDLTPEQVEIEAGKIENEWGTYQQDLANVLDAFIQVMVNQAMFTPLPTMA